MCPTLWSLWGCTLFVFAFLAVSCPFRSTMYSPCSSSTSTIIAKTASATKCDVCRHVETSCRVCSRPIPIPVPHTLQPSNDSSIESALEGHIVAMHDPDRRSRYLRSGFLGSQAGQKWYHSATMRVESIVARPRSGASAHHEGKFGVADQIFKPRTLL